MEKASFDQLNKLFEIAAGKRSCQTLFSTRNLRAVTQISQPYVINIIPRRLPKKVVPGEHFVLKDLSFYTEAREADAQARQERLNQREERRQKGTLRRAPVEKRPAPFPPARSSAEKKKKVPTKGIVIRSLVPSSSSASSSESSPPRRVSGQYGSGPSVPASEWLLPAVEEEPTVNQPGFPRPHPDDAAMLAPDQPTVEEANPP